MKPRGTNDLTDLEFKTPRGSDQCYWFVVHEDENKLVLLTWKSRNREGLLVLFILEFIKPWSPIDLTDLQFEKPKAPISVNNLEFFSPRDLIDFLNWNSRNRVVWLMIGLILLIWSSRDQEAWLALMILNWSASSWKNNIMKLSLF